MREATSVTIYPDSETVYVPRGYVSEKHGTICRVNIDFNACIQTESWQNMQLLVDALNEAIQQAIAAEQAEPVSA